MKRHLLAQLAGLLILASFFIMCTSAPEQGCRSDGDCVKSETKKQCELKTGKCICPSWSDKECEEKTQSGVDLKVCINSKLNEKHCGACDNKCKEGEKCSSGVCCLKNELYCGKTCTDPSSAQEHCGKCGNACRPPMKCIRGGCECPNGLVKCGDKCVNKFIDPSNCGICEMQCKSPKNLCINGSCKSSCPPETSTLCTASGKQGCYNTQESDTNCGKCGNQCPSDKECRQGSCQCPAGFRSCGNGKCIDPLTNSEHCGECSSSCSNGKVCASGECKSSCPKSTPSKCFSGCFDLQNNSHHCGSCGNKCQKGKICQVGKCRCPKGQILCSGKCRFLNTFSFCGSCSNTCKGGERCNAGTCVRSCPKETPTACFGGCFNLEKSPQHCGICGTSCPIGKECVSGYCNCTESKIACLGTCIPKVKATDKLCGKCVNCPKEKNGCCNNLCVDRSSDSSHCGTCGNNCSSGDICDKGRCCPQGHAWCSLKGLCFNLSKDPNNCGQCGKNCGQQVCIAGQCSPCGSTASCPKPLQCKQGSCLCDQTCSWLSQAGKVAGNGSNGFIETKDIVTFTKQGQNYTYITGFFQVSASFGSIQLYAQNRDVFVAKLDSQGTFLWAISAGGSEDDEGTALSLDTAGNLYVAGNFAETASFGSKLKLKATKSGIFIAKINPQGKFQWVLKAESDKSILVQDMTIRADGHELYICGESQGKVSFSNNKFSNPRAEFFIASITNNTSKATFKWANSRVGSPTSSSEANSIAIDNAGMLYVAGKLDSKGYFWSRSNETNPSAYEGAFLFKADPKTKKILWSKVMKGSSTVTDLTIQDKMVYATGFFSGSIRTFLSSKIIHSEKDDNDIFWLKMDSQGKELWIASHKNDLSDRGIQIITNSKKESYITGSTNVTGQTKSDIIILKIDANGKMVKSHTINTKSGRSAGTALAFDKNNSIYITGYFKGTLKLEGSLKPITPSNGSLSSKGEQDIFVWKYGSFK